jgi:hypothetical protein
MALLKEAKSTLSDWIAKILLGLITFLAMNIYSDVKELSKLYPVQEQKIRTLEESTLRLTNKVYGLNIANPHPDPKEPE